MSYHEAIMEPKITQEQIYAIALGNCQDAIDFCDLFFGACQVMDDIIDKDTDLSDDAIIAMFLHLNVEIPSNRFYRAHMTYLVPVINHVIRDWLDSVALERSGDETAQRIAWVLRDTFNSILCHCAYCLGGQERMGRVSQMVRAHVFTESFDEYREKLNG